MQSGQNIIERSKMLNSVQKLILVLQNNDTVKLFPKFKLLKLTSNSLHFKQYGLISHTDVFRLVSE